MRNIFVFTAGVKAARAHLKDSISNPIPIERLDSHLTASEAQVLKSAAEGATSFHAWGAQPGERNKQNWTAMQEGDVVLTVFDSRYRYVARVQSKVHSSELAESIWGLDDQGATWEYMYLLTEPQPINVPIASEPASKYLNKRYFGFTKISDDRVERLGSAFGGIDEFVRVAFGVEHQPTAGSAEIDKVEQQTPEHEFSADNREDARRKVLSEIVRRRGQPKFRKDLLKAYSSTCSVTGCGVEAVLEAAHIIGYLGDHTNHVTNGVLLRADIHTLFDLGLLRIDGDFKVHMATSMSKSIYGPLHGTAIRLPLDMTKAPDRKALATRFYEANVDSLNKGASMLKKELSDLDSAA